MMRRLKWWLRERAQVFAPKALYSILVRRSWVHEPELAVLASRAGRSRIGVLSSWSRNATGKAPSWPRA
jgi:hypothetical protein